jgi:hypothetical protein
MKRADRRNHSYDHSVSNPRSRQPEPISTPEIRGVLATVRAQRDEFKQQAIEREETAEQNHRLYLEAQQQHQSTLVLYQEVQSQAQSYFTLYTAEQARSGELLVKYEQAQSETQHYLTLYEESQTQLKFERRSKAGIKGWETRRKRENERLKQEIGEMAVLLRDSLARKEDAINNLEVLAERMDRIQHLVDSVEGEASSNPLSLLQKFQRIWQTVKDILAE